MVTQSARRNSLLVRFPYPPKRTSRPTSNRLVARCRFRVLRGYSALLIWFFLLPGIGQAQELGNENNELNINAQPLSAVESVEVGSGSGSSHTVTILSVVSYQPAGSSASGAVSAVSIEEQSGYNGALEQFQQARYLDAAKRFVAFLEDYPHSILADHAWYWLGESRYLDRGFDDAVTALTTLLDYFPESTLIGAAQLRLAYSYQELRRYPEARRALKNVLETFPDGELAVLAKGVLEDFDAQGH